MVAGKEEGGPQVLAKISHVGMGAKGEARVRSCVVPTPLGLLLFQLRGSDSNSQGHSGHLDRCVVSTISLWPQPGQICPWALSREPVAWWHIQMQSRLAQQRV